MAAEFDIAAHQKALDETPNRHDFWRAAYATMLADWRLEDILEFFAARPLTVDGRTYAGADLLEHFWGEKGRITKGWNYQGVNALEPFMVEKGYDPFAFMRKLLFRNNRATYMPGKVVLGWFYPVMETIFNRYDPREMAFHIIRVFTEAYLPDHVHCRVGRVKEGEWTLTYMMYAADRTFRTASPLNFDHIAGPQILAAPRMLDLPEFEDIAYVGDCRRPEDILWHGEFGRGAEGLRMDGRIIARWQRLSAFARRLSLDFGGLDIPDRDVLVAEEDIACPRRKRTVVYRGCAYGAPGYISRIRHKKVSRAERKFMRHFVADAAREEDLFHPELERRHFALMERTRRRLDFAWWEGDESITINGEHLTKGIPARILRNILQGFIKGRTEFEYREFKRDDDISLGQKNSNFEVRLYRLMGTLAERCADFRIEKSERGRFRVNCPCPVGLLEREGTVQKAGNG
jgi:hypothetical protein